MIKKILKRFFIFTLVIGIPTSLYALVYTANVEKPQVASVTTEALPVTPIATNTPAKTITLAQNTKPAVKKPVVAKKKAPAKKKVVKKKAKKKERLIPVPALITPETAPHSGR